MSFISTCPYCKKDFEAEEQWIGRIAACPSCGKQIVIQHYDGNAAWSQCGGNRHGGQVPPPNVNAESIKHNAQEAIRSTFKLDNLEGFSFSRFMRQVFKRHKWEEIEEYMSIGTPHNIPPLNEVQPIWPAPWLFVRMIAFTVILYLILVNYGVRLIGLYNALSPILVVGVVGIPFATLLFFWEVNIPKNISMLSLLRIVLISGFASIAVTAIIHILLGGSPGNAIWAGPIEETAKALVMLIFIRNPKHRFKLNGLLIGAAVGAGFAILETGGSYLFNQASEEDLTIVKIAIETMQVRALLAPFGHVAYSAIVGFALWRAKTAKGAFISNLMSSAFLPLFALSVGIHMFWNSSLLASESLIKTAIVGVIEYGIIIFLIQEGINEVRKIKETESDDRPAA